MATEPPSYHFSQQLVHGEQGEAFLDRYFSRWFHIEAATPTDQRRGIDRFYTTRDQKRRFAVEYKTDGRGSETGNAFIETVSVDSSGKAGWVYTSHADYLLYYLPGGGLIYMVRMDALRAHLLTWQDQYPLRRIPNDGYNSFGLLVPLIELGKYCEGVFRADDTLPGS